MKWKANKSNENDDLNWKTGDENKTKTKTIKKQVK